MAQEQGGQEFEASTQRIEAFSDGVFAIAITLLVLELRVPEGLEGGSLEAALLHLWPSYLGYILSFVMIGIYWANHHYVFKLYKSTDHVFNLLNVFFLMCISFLPFPTAVLGSHLTDPDGQRTASVFYAFGLFLPSIGWFLMWLYASRGYRLIDPRLAPSFVDFLTRQYIISILLFLAALAAASINPTVGLAIAMGLTSLYLLPPRKPVYIKDETNTPF